MRDRTMLVIDDEQRMADSLRDLLRQDGYQCDAAYGGREGIEALRHKSYQVVVTDLRMQEVDGLELIRYLYEHAPRTQVIVITGHASAESAIEAVHYHVFDYLRKPFNFDQIRLVVERAFAGLEADQLREDTAAMITHDIKIPLTSIIGFASMIYDRQRKEFHPRAREFAEAIQANGQKILAMIENYLTTCKIEAGTLQVTPVTVDLRELIHDVVEMARLGAARRDRTIEVEISGIPQTIEIDEPLICRAVGNILQNAIKYSSEGGPIRLRARRVGAACSPIRTEAALIETLNHTTLTSPGELEGIFQRYKRTSGGAGIEGAGLGLYVVQAIARAHGGEATCELLEEGVVRFAIYLPLGSD